MNRVHMKGKGTALRIGEVDIQSCQGKNTPHSLKNQNDLEKEQAGVIMLPDQTLL